MTTTRTTEPTSITQGERVEWTREFCPNDYPATLYTAKWVFRGPSTGFDVNGTANGTRFDAVLTVAQTAAMAVGVWKWWAYVTEIADALNVVNVGEGVLNVRQGAPTSTAILDTRSENEIILESLQTAFNTTITVAEYEIATPAGSRRVKYTSRADLFNQIKYYQGLVSNERRVARVNAGGSYWRTTKARISEK